MAINDSSDDLPLDVAELLSIPADDAEAVFAVAVDDEHISATVYQADDVDVDPEMFWMNVGAAAAEGGANPVTLMNGAARNLPDE